MKPQIYERAGRALTIAEPESSFWFSRTEGVARVAERVRRVAVWRAYEPLEDVLRGVRAHAEVLRAVGGGAVPTFVEKLEQDARMLGFVHTDDRLVGWEEAVQRELDVRRTIDPQLAVAFVSELVDVLRSLALDRRDDITFRPLDDWGLTAHGALTVAFHAYPDWRHYSHGAAAGLLEADYSYLAPESVDGRKPTAETFVYSVGYALYRMLAGAPPFVGDTAIATLVAVRTDPAPDLATRRAGLPDSLTRLTNACLAKPPEDRPTLDEVRGELTAIGSEAFVLDHWVERHFAKAREARRRLEAALERMDFDASYRTLRYVDQEFET